MKRKFHLINIEIILPSQKRIKVEKLTIKLKNKMSTKEFQDELEYLKRSPKYSNNQQDSDHLTYDTEDDDICSETSTVKNDYLSDNPVLEYDHKIETMPHEPIIDVEFSSESEIETDNESIVRTPRSENEWDEWAKKLSQMNRYVKGEVMEVKIKNQLESYGFTVTKTQSKVNNQIIGDNGIDHLFQIRINGKMVRGIIQSKCWKNELESGVVRDLQGVLANQYPERIGIIVINGGGISQRAKNLTKNSNNTILVYNFNELRYLKNDLKRLLKQNKLLTKYHQIEEFENGKITEHNLKTKKKVTHTYKKLKRYTTY